jgi:hypothetical protein
VVYRTTENLRAPWWHVGQRVGLELFVFAMVRCSRQDGALRRVDDERWDGEKG